MNRRELLIGASALSVTTSLPASATPAQNNVRVLIYNISQPYFSADYGRDLARSTGRKLIFRQRLSGSGIMMKSDESGAHVARLLTVAEREAEDEKDRAIFRLVDFSEDSSRPEPDMERRAISHLVRDFGDEDRFPDLLLAHEPSLITLFPRDTFSLDL